METMSLHISKIKTDVPVHVVADHWKSKVGELPSIESLTLGQKCYVPSGLGGVYSVTCESITPEKISFIGQHESIKGDIYECALNAPVMGDKEFTSLYNAIYKSKVPLTTELRKTLCKADLQGYVNIQSHTQYGFNSNGWARGKQLELY
jgi:hypothetical protein